MSIWSILLSSTTIWLTLYGVNQMSIQRYCSVPTIKDARKVVWLNIPFLMILSVMCCLVGFMVLAYFYYCNPLETGEINTPDQLVVLFAVKVTQNYPGVAGLFLACVFAASLSTVSAGYNSIAAVIYNDFVKPHFESRALLINKIVALLAGLISTGLAFACKPLGGILSSSVGLLGTTTGPVVGLFCLGVFAKNVSTKATIVGFIGSTAFCVFLWVSNVVEEPYKDYRLPTNSSLKGCHGHAFTPTKIPTSYDPHFGRPGAFYFSKISTFSYAFIGLFFVVLISLILSICIRTGHEKYSSERRHSLTWSGRPKKPSPLA
ncbi:hypothetical protein L596_010419 [Steinernema carpocapsae]|uniref:Sodium/solute symporter n=1 Tax=Steinernema carpocapsae TaxID=34508 RepID=A0A4U5PJ13_STECR|nr:hypothetical protein L596_010419 [Steinernema carpocapsae]